MLFVLTWGYKLARNMALDT